MLRYSTNKKTFAAASMFHLDATPAKRSHLALALHGLIGNKASQKVVRSISAINQSVQLIDFSWLRLDISAKSVTAEQVNSDLNLVLRCSIPGMHASVCNAINKAVARTARNTVIY